MYKILSKTKLADRIYRMTVSAPEIANKVKAGQFLILRVNETGERIPLTYCDWSREDGTISFSFLVIGKTTKLLSTLNEGDSILDIAGPLGQPTHVEKYGHVVCISGGVGTAEILPVAKAYKEAGNKVTVIIGARSANMLILEDELSASVDAFLIATDDGSKGYHGFGIELLKELAQKEKIDLVFTVGPVPMMRAVSNLTEDLGIEAVASLNPIMVDGTGMCGACRVEVGGQTMFGCVDGPEFDAHQVNWELLMSRQRTYLEEEKKSFEKFEEACSCHPS